MRMHQYSSPHLGGILKAGPVALENLDVILHLVLGIHRLGDGLNCGRQTNTRVSSTRQVSRSRSRSRFCKHTRAEGGDKQLKGATCSDNSEKATSRIMHHALVQHRNQTIKQNDEMTCSQSGCLC